MARLVVILVAVLVALGPPTFASHEVFYRYTVLGFVEDAAGHPIATHEVEVVRDKTGLAYRGHTDAAGFYVLVLRLGDESAGERLTFRAAGLRTQVTARFDPDNHTDERGTRIDVEGAHAVERAERFRSTLARYVAGIAGSPRRH